MPDPLYRNVAIVTGAGRERGIGPAVAMRLARDGARLVISDIGRTSLEGSPEYPLARLQRERTTHQRKDGAKSREEVDTHSGSENSLGSSSE